MRAAIYARYSSDLQRPTSIEDQVRQCQRTADLKGWAVLQDYVRSDSEVSGATLHSRDGLTSRIEDARKSARPFDCLLIDDTSRLGRNPTRRTQSKRYSKTLFSFLVLCEPTA